MLQKLRLVEHCFKTLVYIPLNSTYSVRKVFLYRGKSGKSNNYLNMFQRLRITEHCLKNIAPFPLYLTHAIREVACWKCETENSSNLYCQSCNALQEPDYKQNYFDLLGLQLSYNINNTDLVSKYHKLQIAFHPDKHANKSEKEKEISENYSTLINKAYATLSNPLQRGLYILKMKGSPINEEGISSNDRQLFMDILEWNDNIDRMGGLKEAVKLTTKLNQIIISLTEEITTAFDANDFEKAGVLLNKMKYYTNVWQKLKIKKQSSGIPD